MILQTVDSGSGEFNLARALFQGDTLTACGLWFELDGELTIPWACDEAIIELPQVYSRSKTNPNDLITLAASAGRARQAIGWGKSSFIWPVKWKGNLAKDSMHVRIVELLTEVERRIYFAAADTVTARYRDNIADAIGIGLWKLGRLGRQSLTAAKARGMKQNRRQG